MVELFLGGARSGKSRLAEARAAELGTSVIYVATATPGDAEMADRIEHHRRRRPGHWALVEEPVALGPVLEAPVPSTTARLVDCLTLWLVNALAAGEETFLNERAALLDALERAAAPVVLVSNEVGAGVVPLGVETRRYVDEAGRLNQAVAARATRVTLVSAGLPLILKENPPA